MYIDHHLQMNIVRSLVGSDHPVSFSQLKDSEIENSLFMYHLNKLISQGIVSKEGDGYSLSVEGARWVNDNGINIKSTEILRVFIALLIKNEEGKYLVGERTGQLKTKINDYMLPTQRYTDELDIDDQISSTIKHFIPEASLLNRQDFGFVQIKANYTNKTMRALFCLSKCETKNFILEEIEGVAFSWLSEDVIKQIDHPSARILLEVIDHSSHDDLAMNVSKFVG